MTEQPEDIQEVTVEPVAEEPEEPVVEEPVVVEPSAPPPTPKAPKMAPRKSARVVAPLAEPPPVPVIDASFWSSMLQTKREMDRQATASRYANLVKL
jgi:hypothetical protein